MVCALHLKTSSLYENRAAGSGRKIFCAGESVKSFITVSAAACVSLIWKMSRRRGAADMEENRPPACRVTQKYAYHSHTKSSASAKWIGSCNY